ncbi:MAG: hypothetical protein ACOYIQ_02110 [Christensenellales bacterium]|jgi:hypothetical protein
MENNSGSDYQANTTEERKSEDEKAVLFDEPLLPNGDNNEADELAREDAEINRKLKKRIFLAVITLIAGLAVFYFTVVRNYAKTPAAPPTSGEDSSVIR